MSESKTLTEVLASLPEGVKVPPPPVAPYTRKFGYQFKRPSTPSEKFVTNSLYSGRLDLKENNDCEFQDWPN